LHRATDVEAVSGQSNANGHVELGDQAVDRLGSLIVLTMTQRGSAITSK
jgi:hypothetical protein